MGTKVRETELDQRKSTIGDEAHSQLNIDCENLACVDVQSWSLVSF